MQVSGLSLSQFRACTYYISAVKYGSNIIVHPDAHERPAKADGTANCTARLTVTSSDGAGARVTTRGQRGPYACWHAYRDVLAEVFTRYPDAVIRAGFHWRAVYRGRDGFLAAYPETAHFLMGSPASPVTMPELCACDPVTQDAREELTWQPLPEIRYSDPGWPRLEEPGYVSPAVARAARVHAENEKLLSDHIDPYVFGPDPSRNGHRQTSQY